MQKLSVVDQRQRMGIQRKFGKRLAEIRNQKKITQEKFAFDIGVDRTYISYIERGERNPSLFLLYKIAKELKIKLSDLINF